MNNPSRSRRTEIILQIFSYSWILWFIIPFLLLMVVVATKFSLVSAVIHDSRFWMAFFISLISAFAVIILTATFAIPTAYFLAYHNFPYQGSLETLLIDIPQTFPPVAVGVIYLFIFGSNSPINLAFTFTAVIIAKLIVSAPFTLSHTLRKFREIKQQKIDLVARSLGAGPKDLLFRVLIPLSKRDIVAGLTLSWARAMGEFGGSLIFAGVIAYKTEILPTYTNRVVSVNPYLALAATAVMTIFAVVAITAVRSLINRKRK